MENNVILGTKDLLKGIKLATNALRPTYGQYGINAILECEEIPYHKIVNDAFTIVDSIKTHNRVERLGLNLVKELMTRQDGLSGDGRKTTAIIADELISLGSTLDMPKVKLKQELDALIPLVEAKIDQHKRHITENEVNLVASIAGESKELGDLLGEIYKKIGKDGLIDVEPSGTHTTHYKITEGVRFKDAAYLATTMINDQQSKKAVYENPTVLVTKKKISTVREIDPLIQTLIAQGKKSLVIFTDDMESSVAAALVKTHLNPEIPISILIIKAPVIFKQYIFEDFAKCTGATIVEDATGLSLKSLPLSALGTCGKIITDAKETIVLGTQDISEHIASLKEEGTEDSRHRLAWLVTKTCNLYLGGNSESDLFYKTMKCKDAINASQKALADGVVHGGGCTLKDIALELRDEAGEHNPVQSMLSKALLAPSMQLYINSGKTETAADENVLDASLVLKNAVRSAIGLVSTALTIGVSMPILPKSEEELALIGATKKVF